MNNLKFRAWNKSQKRMIDVFGFNEDLIFSQSFDSPEFDKNIFKIEDCDIMQFTGENDKNGIEIFQSDIVNDDELGKGIVVFQNGCFFMMYDAETNMEFLGIKNDKFGRLQQKRIVEKIGNIYQNQEMIK